MPSTSKHLKWYNTVKCISSVRHLVNHLNLFFFKRFISIFIFISDSRTAKQSITTLLFEWKVLPIIIFIRNLLKVLIHFHNCEICFIWVPGHAGISDNERADFLARKNPLLLTLTAPHSLQITTFVQLFSWAHQSLLWLPPSSIHSPY